MSVILLLQTAASNVNQSANNAATHAPMEKQPALMSLIYMGGLALMIIWLIVALIRFRRQRSALAAVAAADLPEEVRERLGSTTTNRGLRVLRWFFIVLALTIYGFHVYWAQFAAQTNERFQELSYKDLRIRRLSDATLRGWIYDRNGKPLAYYKNENGNIVREYPMDEAFAHLFGTDFGDAGLERALFTVKTSDVPEAWQLVTGGGIKQVANTDVRLTIDADLQQALITELKTAKEVRSHRAAAVILNPQTGEILAMASWPTYSLKQVQGNEEAYRQLAADKRDNPLLDRARFTYYTPGSSFKTLTMIAAFLAGKQDAVFSGTPGGYFEPSFPKPITDDNGSCESGTCGPLHIDQAYQHSSNQYFAQMGVALGPENLKRAATLVGIGAMDTDAQAASGPLEPQIINASTDAIKRAVAPRQATMVTNSKLTRFDLAQEGYGQGLASQETPFQMALLAATVANMNGNLMKPMIELGRQPEVYNQVVPPEIGAELRRIMGLVTSGGTGQKALADVHRQGIITGGKTGTAQHEVPKYDASGKPVTRPKIERDNKGNIIRISQEIVREERTRSDAWFLCIAPLDHPLIAMAVLVEGPGPGISNYGGSYAAPIAARLVLKARDLGLLGQPRKNPNETTPNNRRQTVKPAARR
jgi:peptidoglycan glycosyltransferase